MQLCLALDLTYNWRALTYLTWKEAGVIESEFAEIGTERVIKEFLTYRVPGPIYLTKGKLFGHSPDTPITLPSWLSEEEVNYYVTKFDQKGFTGGINYYRNFDRYVYMFQLFPRFNS